MNRRKIPNRGQTNCNCGRYYDYITDPRTTQLHAKIFKFLNQVKKKKIITQFSFITYVNESALSWKTKPLVEKTNAKL